MSQTWLITFRWSATICTNAHEKNQNFSNTNTIFIVSKKAGEQPKYEREYENRKDRSVTASNKTSTIERAPDNDRYIKAETCLRPWQYGCIPSVSKANKKKHLYETKNSLSAEKITSDSNRFREKLDENHASTFESISITESFFVSRIINIAWTLRSNLKGYIFHQFLSTNLKFYETNSFETTQTWKLKLISAKIELRVLT